jgi:hypothetical protein
MHPYVQISGLGAFGTTDVDNEPKKTGILTSVMRPEKKINNNQPCYNIRKVKQNP